MDLRITGADQLADVAKALRAADDKDLRKEFYRGLNSAVKPLREDVKGHVGDYVPGGYAGTLSKALKVTTKRRTGAKTAGITLVAQAKSRSKGRRVGPIDAGTLRHPLFGNRGFWFTTKVKPGFFTQRVADNADKVRKELLDVMDDIVRKIARKV